MSTINTTKPTSTHTAKPIKTNTSPLPGLKGFATKSVTIPPQPGTNNVLELGWNGHMYLIQRGRKIQVPLPLYHILDHAGLIQKAGHA